MNIKTPKDKFQGQIQVLVGLFLNQKSLKGYIILLISKTIHIFEAVLKNDAFFVYIVVNKYNFSNQSLKVISEIFSQIIKYFRI